MAQLGSPLHEVLIGAAADAEGVDAWRNTSRLVFFATILLDELKNIRLVVDATVSQQENIPVFSQFFTLFELKQFMKWSVDLSRAIISIIT